jgi:hypothetical protein
LEIYMSYFLDTPVEVALVNPRPLIAGNVPEPELRRALAPWRLDTMATDELAGGEVYDVKRTGPANFHTIDPDGLQVLWLPGRGRGAVRCGASVEWSEGASPLELVTAWTRVTPQRS